MLEQLLQLNHVRYVYDTPEGKRRAKLQLTLINGIFSVVVVLVLLNIVLKITDTIDFSWEMIGILAVGLALAPIVHVLVQTGYQEFSAYLIVLSFVIPYLGIFFVSPSADNIAIVGFIIPILSAAILINTRMMLLVAAIFSGVYIVSIGLQIVNETFPARLDPYDYAFQAAQSFLVMLVIGAFLLHHYIGEANRTMQENVDMNRVIQSVTQISRRLAETSVNENFYKKIVEVIRDAFDLHSVHLFNKRGTEQFELLAATGLIGLRLVSEGRRIDVTRDSTAGLAYRQKMAVQTTMQSPLEQRVDFLLATRSELVVPLLSSKLEVIGLLVLHSEEEDVFADQEIALLETVASELALIFDQKQLQDNIATLERQLGESQQKYSDLQVELRRLRQEAAGQVWDDYLSFRNKQAGFEWNGGKTTPWHDNETPVTQKPYIENMDDGRKRIIIPIMFGDEPYGDMIFEADGDVTWSQQTIDLATAVANRLALALDNARLFDQAQTIAVREQLVSSVSSELQDARKIELLVNRAAALFNRALSAEQTNIRMRISQQTEKMDINELPPITNQ